jgi:hypothetical protein
MKRLLLFLFLLPFLLNGITVSGQLWKQRRMEISGGIGPSFFFGDIGGFSKKENILGLKDITFLQTRYNINGSVRYRCLDNLSVRFSLSQARLRATDDRGSNESRKMEAKMNIFEPALLGEFYFIKNQNESSWRFSRGKQLFRSMLSSIDMYTFTGFGGAIYSVKGNSALQNSKGFQTGGFTTVIPIGIGAKLIFSPDIDFGIEVGGRYSFSDYIDGYSSQYSSSNDVYYFLDLTVTYKMMTNRKGWPTFKRR